MLENKIPSELGYLKKLKYFNISHNLLTGSIPTELDKMISLEGLSLYDNQFVGSVDYLCDNKVKGGSYEEIISFTMLSSVYTFQYDFGLEVDCDGNVSVLECGCCVCVN